MIVKIQSNRTISGLGNSGNLTVIMHANFDSYQAWQPNVNHMMIKTKMGCGIMDIPSHIYPVDVLLGMVEIKGAITPEDIKNNYFLNERSPLSDWDKNKLHPLVKQSCQNEDIYKCSQKTISKDDYERGIMFFDAPSSRNCLIKVRNNRKHTNLLRL